MVADMVVRANSQLRNRKIEGTAVAVKVLAAGDSAENRGGVVDHPLGSDIRARHAMAVARNGVTDKVTLTPVLNLPDQGAAVAAFEGARREGGPRRDGGNEEGEGGHCCGGDEAENPVD